MLKPKIEPNKLEQKKSSSSKRSKNNKSKKDLVVDEIIKIEVDSSTIPEGSVFKGYKKYHVQELVSYAKTSQYLLAQWKTPEGKYISAKLPAEIEGWHYGPGLRSHIIYQNQKNRVPQKKIYEELKDKGIQISEGQIEEILRKVGKKFVGEKQDILKAGLKSAEFIATDDTGARHKAKNGYCTVICNDFFTYFKSSDRKTRINFLEILRGERTDYLINEDSISYLKLHKISEDDLRLIESYKGTRFEDKSSLEEFFQACKISSKSSKRLLTESMIVGLIFEEGMINKDLILLSDGAPQFNLLSHALCWIHIERPLRKLIPKKLEESDLIELIQKLLWSFYQKLKSYKENPKDQEKKLLQDEFDKIFNQLTGYSALDKILEGIFKNKELLLKVLESPFLPLHNNGSERDIREYVIKRKISGGTRSEAGRELRDTFTSLSKTCSKNNISFWEFLKDRISGTDKIPYLPNLVEEKLLQVPGP